MEIIKKIWNYPLITVKRFVLLLVLLEVWTYYEKWLYYKMAECFLYMQQQQQDNTAIDKGNGEPGTLDHSQDEKSS